MKRFSILLLLFMVASCGQSGKTVRADQRYGKVGAVYSGDVIFWFDGAEYNSATGNAVPESVYLYGDFNDWIMGSDGFELTNDGSGLFTATVSLSTFTSIWGDEGHFYRFSLDGVPSEDMDSYSAAFGPYTLFKDGKPFLSVVEE